MLVTACLMSLVIALYWEKNLFESISCLIFFGSIEIMYASACMLNFHKRAWYLVVLWHCPWQSCFHGIMEPRRSSNLIYKTSFLWATYIMLYQLIPRTFKVGKYSHATVERAQRRADEATKRADDAEKQCMLLANELIEMKENSAAQNEIVELYISQLGFSLLVIKIMDLTFHVLWELISYESIVVKWLWGESSAFLSWN